MRNSPESLGITTLEVERMTIAITGHWTKFTGYKKNYSILPTRRFKTTVPNFVTGSYNFDDVGAHASLLTSISTVQFYKLEGDMI